MSITKVTAEVKHPASAKSPKGHTKRTTFEEDEVDDARLGDMQHHAQHATAKFPEYPEGNVECSLVGTTDDGHRTEIYSKKLNEVGAVEFQKFVVDRHKDFLTNYPRA